VRSRVLLGVGAWLLGAVCATAGSLYAVGQLGHGLLAQPTKQLSVAVVNADLAREKHPGSQESSRKAAAPGHPSKSRAPRHRTKHSPAPVGTPVTAPPSPSPAPSSAAAIVLTSSDGSAAAVCEPGGAYLVYWSPQPGFEADDVTRGPAAVASVVFSNDSGGILMRVSCRDGVPVKQLSSAWRDDGGGDSGHDN
jgi:hypothetical protein